MRKIITLLALTVGLSACQHQEEMATVKKGEVKAAWGSSDKWATWWSNGYTLYNNVWGSGTGPQSIWANSSSNWGVWSDQGNWGGIKSYPNCSKYIGRSISSLGGCVSSFNVSTPWDGAWTATYDIFDANKANEIMLWMNYTSNGNGSGNIKPISYNWDANGNPIATHWNVYIGGHNFNVFRGNNGGTNVYSFLRTSKTNAGTVDIKAIMDWIRSQGWIGDVTLGDVQFGYEITSCSGGRNFVTNSYSVNYW